MALFRCNLCKREFEAAKPACANCELDPAKDPRDAELLVELKTIHFDAPTRIPGRGVGFAACDSKKRTGVGSDQFSGEKTSVNCPKCKASAAYLGEDTPPATMPDANILKIASLEEAKAAAKAPVAAPESPAAEAANESPIVEPTKAAPEKPDPMAKKAGK